MPLGPTSISTKKNVPVTLWPDAPDPRTQPGYGVAGMGSALGNIGDMEMGGRNQRSRYPPWKDPWGIQEEGGGRGPVP